MGKRGPKTERGKAVVRLNPVKHGVLSQTPVLPLVEREEDWVTLRDGTREYFQVEGIVEEGLADQIAMVMWRRFRLVRFETESISRYLEEVPEDYERMRAAAKLPREGQAKAIEEMDRMLSARLLPGSETVEKIMRYETRLHRFLLQSINQLLVLQALRMGRGMPPDLLRGKTTATERDEELSGRIRSSRKRILRPAEGVVGRRK